MEIYSEYYPSIVKAFSDYDKNWEAYKGLVICGSHNPKNIDFLIDRIHQYRVSGEPFYGECFGYQLAAVEYARNVLNIKYATSEEFGEGGIHVVKKNKNGLNVGLGEDGQSYWNNYHVELDNWDIPNHFFIAQYHASYQSYKKNPHILIKSFLDYAKKMANKNSAKPWWRF